MKKALYITALCGSLLYALTVVVLIILSRQLPYASQVGMKRDYDCYWTNFGVACGKFVANGEWLQFLYNLPTSLLLGPFVIILNPTFRVILTALAIYAPLVFLVYALCNRLKRKTPAS